MTLYRLKVADAKDVLAAVANLQPTGKTVKPGDPPGPIETPREPVIIIVD